METFSTTSHNTHVGNSSPKVNPLFQNEILGVFCLTQIPS